MERELINPEGVFAHPAYTGVITVTDPRKFHFIAGAPRPIRSTTPASHQAISAPSTGT
jgi:hypothetical protein